MKVATDVRRCLITMVVVSGSPFAWGNLLVNPSAVVTMLVRVSVLVGRRGSRDADLMDGLVRHRHHAGLQRSQENERERQRGT